MDKRLEQFVNAGREAQASVENLCQIATLKTDDLVWVKNPWMKEITESLAIVVEINFPNRCLVVRKRRIKTTSCWGPELAIPFSDFLRVEQRV